MTSLRVRPSPRTALPGDEPLVIEPAAEEGGRAARPAPGAIVGQVAARDGIHLVEVVVDGWRFELEVEPAERAALRERAARGRAEGSGGGPLEVRAIIPGRVVSVAVGAGHAVTAGQPLLVLEAMKMQNELRAPRDGTVGRVEATPGATVELGDLLLVLE